MVAVILLSGMIGFLAGLVAVMTGGGLSGFAFWYASGATGAAAILGLTGAILCRQGFARHLAGPTKPIARIAEPSQK
ncbi:MAG: hypothetical protein HLUCCA08_08245 [Rhodobacteraceae bacterium HLUCCA08]|nr:MAG: hypothetical protein HLUCCA08_08245 [Rhodobacteraceae bacterium HLUCCA08]